MVKPAASEHRVAARRILRSVSCTTTQYLFLPKKMPPSTPWYGLSLFQSSRFLLILWPGREPRSKPSRGFYPTAHGARTSGTRTVNGIPLKPIFRSDLKPRSVTPFAPNARRSSRRITSATMSAGNQCREVQFNCRRGCSSFVPVHPLSYYPGFGWLCRTRLNRSSDCSTIQWEIRADGTANRSEPTNVGQIISSLLKWSQYLMCASSMLSLLGK